MTSSPVFFTLNVSVPDGRLVADSRHSVAVDSTPIVPAPPLAGAFETQPAVQRDDDQREDGDGGRDGHGEQAGHRSSGGLVVAPGGDGPGGGQAGVDTDRRCRRARRGRPGGRRRGSQTWRTNRIVTGTM